MYCPDSAYSQSGHLGGGGGESFVTVVCVVSIPLVREVEDRIVSVC